MTKFKNSENLKNTRTCQLNVVAIQSDKRTGFTLAEVLITLGIIGVVAAITMPALIKNYQKHAYVNQLKTTYSILQNGFKQMLADEGVDRLEDTSIFQSIGGSATAATNGAPGETYKVCTPYYSPGNLSTSENCREFYKKLSKYFKIISIEDIENNNDAAKKAGIAYKYLNNGQDYLRIGVTKLVLSNGTYIVPQNIYSQPYKYLAGRQPYPYGGSLGQFIVDINGSKGPNIYGRDVFYLYIANNGTIIPCGSKAMGLLLQNNEDFHYWTITTTRINKCTTTETTEGYGCAGRIMDEGWKMNY